MLSRLRDVEGLNIPRPGMLRAERNQACVHFGRDVKGLNIPQHRDVKLNELPKQIFMLLPLLLHWLQQHTNLLWQFIQLNIHAEGC